jgi:hypothetical protein
MLVSFHWSKMEACHLELVGVSGSLTIHGQGTAIFLATSGDDEVVLRIHNCLFSFGEFNLLSVSQCQLAEGNKLDFAVGNPILHLGSAFSDDPDNTSARSFVLAFRIMKLTIQEQGNNPWLAHGTPHLQVRTDYIDTETGIKRKQVIETAEF